MQIKAKQNPLATQCMQMKKSFLVNW